MDVTKVKRIIGQCSDQRELRQLKVHIERRIQTIQHRAYAANVDAAWDRLKDVSVGDTLHVATKGVFVGGDIQRGDSFKVSFVQPRAKRIWFFGEDGKEHAFYMGPRELLRYEMSRAAPDNPMSKESREIHKRMGKRLSEAGIL